MKRCRTILAAALALCAAQACAAEAAKKHVVTFRCLDGTILKQVQVAHGGKAVAPAAPSVPDFKFKGWDGADRLACVTNDVQAWALYETTKPLPPSTKIESQPIVERDVPYSLDEYFSIYSNLAWSDEFSGSELSVSPGGFGGGWWAMMGGGGGNPDGKNWLYDMEQRNHELGRMSGADNLSVSNGCMWINLRRENRDRFEFTSSAIRSNGKVAFRFGRCEARLKLTKQRGAWPGFWMMGSTGMWPNCGELDVMEQPAGGEWMTGTLHIPNPKERWATIQNSAPVSPSDGVHFGDGFHRFGVIVTEREIVWYLDERIFLRVDIRDSRYEIFRSKSLYILMGIGMGGAWINGFKDDGKVTCAADIPDFRSVDYVVDYCRIFTNMKQGATAARPQVRAALSAPVRATVWRGWQMHWGKPGAGYYQSHLAGSERYHVQTALREYFARDRPDVVALMPIPIVRTDERKAEFGVPGAETCFFSANGNCWNSHDERERLRGVVMFNSERFSSSGTSVGPLRISDDPSFTNCYAVCADLLENGTGARAKVVAVNVVSTNGVGCANLFPTLNSLKGEKAIVLFQSMDPRFHASLKGQAASGLDRSFKYLGEYRAGQAAQFAYATKSASASAENPAPLSVPKPNGKPSGVHTNQALTATVKW